MSSCIKSIPYDFELISGSSGVNYYYVKVWLLVAESKVYSFFSRSDLLDNFMLASESGVKDLYVTSASLLCSPTKLTDIYNIIHSYVSSSDTN